MKKNLLYLLALVCSLTLFAACSSDDDDTMLVNDELLKGLDKELDDFLKELLEK